MRINFIPNPKFKHPAPEIRVGSVVRWKPGSDKYVVCNISKGCLPYYARSSPGAAGISPMPSELEILPLHVSGISESGEWEYAPITLPAPPYSWDQYPPRAGMVVECSNWEKEPSKGFRFLVADGCLFSAIDGDANTQLRRVGLTEMQMNYLPRPDLMPQFVEGE